MRGIIIVDCGFEAACIRFFIAASGEDDKAAQTSSCSETLRGKKHCKPSVGLDADFMKRELHMFLF
jgi:hypothetical protein